MSASMRQGLPVVKLSEKPGQRYEVDEEALASVLLRPDVRALPVVVVSVAGAYRGGKSFILDFFLRYLTAPRSSQLNGEWLGRDDQHLEGFDWRGGSNANTKGIHIWPEPIIAKNESTGEKIAVVLMDTQGTFDTDSEMGDISGIFALSTLLSSVQIYNVRANIGEDDLQNLQLFTEYGKLARAAEGKAFQTLTFLIRDWMFEYEYPNGYAGGEEMLKKKLMAKPNQKKQLREVREHIHSCFEKLQCFLMPHPGLTVAGHRFKGCLHDLTPEFKTSLLELVPSLFDPNNLTPKMINGEKVQAQSLLEYFKQYVNIFNSDEVPEAKTIFQATVAACMMSALREARTHYESKMESHFVQGKTVPVTLMQSWHRTAAAAAIDHFKSKRKLGPQGKIEKYMADFKKDLEALLSLYLWQNDVKTREVVSLVKKTYEECVGGVCNVQERLCLHKQDLAALHERATQEALAAFNNGRMEVPGVEDEERNNLIQNLEQRYQQLCAINEQNNRNAMLEARELYLSRMKDQVNQAGISTEALRNQHDLCMAAAVQRFQSYRNRPTEQPEDPDVDKLKEEMQEYFEDIEKNNLHSNVWAMQVAEYAYNNEVCLAWGPQYCCFHPRALEDMHKAAKDHALEQFLTDRVTSEHDTFMDKLLAKIDARYKELKTINELNNKQAVELSLNEYMRLMDRSNRPTTSNIFAVIISLFLGMRSQAVKNHDACKRRALEMFAERRRGGNYGEDQYLNDLKRRIDNALEEYKKS